MQAFTALTRLVLEGYSGPPGVLDLSPLRVLAHLEVRGCPSLLRADLTISSLSTLTTLELDTGVKLLLADPPQNDAGLLRLPAVVDATATSQFVGLALPKVLQALALDFSGVTHPPDLSRLTRLQRLLLVGSPSLAELPDLGPLRLLTCLGVLRWGALARLQLPDSLEEALVAQCDALAAISSGADAGAGVAAGAEQGQLLRRLRVFDCPALMSLASVTAVEHLEVQRCPKLPQLQLGSSTEQLRVVGCERLAAIIGLTQPLSPPIDQQEPSQLLLASLSRLEVGACPGLQPLQCLRHLPQLKHVVYDTPGGVHVAWDGEGGACPYLSAQRRRAAGWGWLSAVAVAALIVALIWGFCSWYRSSQAVRGIHCCA
jgi:hypothetical protein